MEKTCESRGNARTIPNNSIGMFQHSMVDKYRTVAPFDTAFSQPLKFPHAQSGRSVSGIPTQGSHRRQKEQNSSLPDLFLSCRVQPCKPGSSLDYSVDLTSF